MVLCRRLGLRAVEVEGAIPQQVSHGGIAIRHFRPGGGAFNEKDFTPAKGKPVKLQMFVCGNQIEAFLDDRACLSTRVLDRLEYRVAIEIAGGRATISKPLLHYFKYKKGK